LGTKTDRWVAICLFLMAILAPVAAMLLAPVPLSLDGPSHLYSAVVMRHLFAGDAFYQQYFHFNSLLVPNWLGPLMTAIFTAHSSVRYGILTMNVAVIALTVGALYFVVQKSSAARPNVEQRFLALAIVMPVAVSAFLSMAFWGFLISADLCFVAVTLLQQERTVRRRCLIWLLVLLGAWAHPVPAMLTALFPILSYVGARSAGGAAPHSAGKLAARFAWDILPWCVAGLAVVSFTLALAKHPATMPFDLKFLLGERLLRMVRADGLNDVSPTATAIGPFVVYVALLGFAALQALSLKRNAGWSGFHWQLSCFAVILLALYFIAPDAIGNGSVISPRLLWMAIAAACLVATSGQLASNMLFLRSLAWLSALIMLVFSAEYVIASRRMAPAVGELNEAMTNLPRHSKMLLLGYALTPGCSRWPLLAKTEPERHMALLATIPRELILLNDYEPATEHFPLEYRDRRFAAITDNFTFTEPENAAWKSGLDAAERGTFVLSWGVPSGRNQGCPAWLDAPLMDTLQQHYALRYQSANASRIQVWERE
jgi:hypothetical protein